ncbi:hypothetical protein JYT87_01305 [Nitrospira defluvii]|nr:hypothetical protein [Nitrospira defluvii]
MDLSTKQEELNETIAVKIMGMCEKCLKNNRVHVPEYSTDRTSSACVVYEIMGMSDKVQERFDDYIHSQITGMKDRLKKDGYSHKREIFFMMIYITSDIICEAALYAIDQNNKVRPKPLLTGMDQEASCTSKA